MVVLPDPFRGMGAWRNSTETQQRSRRRWVVSAGATWRIILLPSYPAQVRGQEKAVTVAAKSGQFTTDKTGKGQFLRGNRRNLAGEWVVTKISSGQGVAFGWNLCNSRSQWAGNMDNGECCSCFGKRVCSFISGKSSTTEDPLEA